jgi:hypothetical protein
VSPPRKRSADRSPTPAGKGIASPDLFAFLSRRRWLKLTLGAGGALLGTGLGGALLLRGWAPSIGGLAHLDDHEYQTLAKLATALFPPAQGFEADVEQMELPRLFDEFLDGEPEENVTDLRRALVLLEYGPLVYEHRFTTFSRLPRVEREEHFRSWMTSDDLTRRMVSVAFRKFLNLVFYDREEVWPHIGYPGPSLGAAR